MLSSIDGKITDLKPLTPSPAPVHPDHKRKWAIFIFRAWWAVIATRTSLSSRVCILKKKKSINLSVDDKLSHELNGVCTLRPSMEEAG